MKFVKIFRNNLIICLILTSCTIIPKKIVLNSPSLDSKGQLSSNFLGFYTNQDNSVYGVIDLDGEKRYSYLIKKYGNNDLIKLKNHLFSNPDGILDFTNKTYIIQLDDLRKFETLNRWNKSNLK
jgi:hypothetical protein